ncbi:ATP synthase F0, B subunit [Candidatus Ruthia magnifica str. Cm (Calyptogena magnifica)]|uniref:ATP synthase subunit b n=1 Tax=Ruthia magnifica subsp. Calyptogena magnifica TaxID=413404 RepID=ATPF_RUTMC|nr:F0F1 ATP synthase subunit B [Candidatus Ruthturnera calyptogenae]A1AXU6.1 RecName: Full=ATP synthase subunit b; AltName: Full=ATP synthase F(0) sector subunit b; AltName: Full=ATPase subunit I; AltName: Full=F-type ATPase subunit b; Short=F-ATPase subunit b [Candidatus Ruthia magnifica str. Cm (Calyptogena magnifica)]ABL02753.1 ATP synthase F0, B subunit [Candidatus Ruthia magnifica str. Cm (Calyptogena magnifica)]
MNINLTMFGQLIMFTMFTWFCMKFVWPPIVMTMEERKKRIESGLLAAERGRSEQEEMQAKAQEMINQSKDQAAEIIANATRQASNMVEDAKDVALKEAGKVKAQAQAQLEQDTIQTRNELKNQMSDLIMQGVSVVLAKEVDVKVHQKMLGKLSQSLS